MFKFLCSVWVVILLLGGTVLILNPPTPADSPATSPTAQEQLQSKSQVRIDAAFGSCRDSDDLDVRGHRCGARAASERKGGK